MTSGFYDKKIKGLYFDFNLEETTKGEIYNKYFSQLLNFLKNNDSCHLQLCFHNRIIQKSCQLSIIFAIYICIVTIPY
jgi:predicted HAD superfamily hydrolase